MALSKRLRYEILRRDNHTCRYCGASAPHVPLRVDHVTPVALGGTDDPTNLATACHDCNAGKSSMPADAAVVADVAQGALRWAAAMELAAENLRLQERPKDEYREAFLAEWNRWHVGKDEDKKTPLPDDWKQSIERFRVAGIPAWMWPDIVDVGMANAKVKPENTFRYCCGVTWNRVAALQAEARRIVEPGAAELDLSPLPSALVSAAREVWRQEAGEDPTHEQEAELRSGVIGAVGAGAAPTEVIEAAKQAAMCGHANITEGLAEMEAEARHMGSLLAWEEAWAASCGGRPPMDAFRVFTKTCSALARTGATSEQLHQAATFAGAHLSPYLHFGLAKDHLLAAEVKWVRAYAVDFWASAVVATTHTWPSDEERAALSKSMDRVRDDGGFNPYDTWAAAAAAGAYGDTDLSPHLTRNLSVFEIAAMPLAGGVN